MLFNSLEFAIFLLVTLVMFYMVPRGLKNILLLLASYYFYSTWSPFFLIFLLISTYLDYSCAIIIEQSRSLPLRRIVFLMSSVINLGILFYFKYLNFFTETLTGLLGGVVPDPLVVYVAPIGMSFYTFQSILYTNDVYHGVIRAERNLLRFSLFMGFFPQLLAGPIESASRLLPQFKKGYKFKYDEFGSGIRLILWGFFKKLVIANNLIYLKILVCYPDQSSALEIPHATVFYFFVFMPMYIYADFSGYCDIAVGVGRLFGIQLTKNFRSPYLARSITELISRWHITLINFFLHFVFQNFLYRFKSKSLKIMAVFIFSGLWHGAGWTFVVWGSLLGIVIIFERKLRRIWSPKGHLIGIPLTYMTFSIIGVVFFSPSLSYYGMLVKNLFSGWSYENIRIFFEVSRYREIIGIDFIRFISLVMCIVFNMVVEIVDEQKGVSNLLQKNPIYFKLPLYLIVLLIIILFGNFNTIGFEYYRF